MYPFAPSMNPAFRSHLDAQLAFFNDLSASLSRSFQSLCELNMQLGHTLFEEGSLAGKQLLGGGNASDAVAAAASRAQPAVDKLRAYQQHVARIVADTQVELTRVTEPHVQTTARTARELADEVARAAADETQKRVLQNREAMDKVSAPFQGGGITNGNGAVHAGDTLQSAGQPEGNTV